ncbi:TPA: hypothetical protein N0F65_004231 [Lagenidium giganteum]|uniref:Uncharacterized protein n=1 Tax=Lagenidium giganteum TaxID=4803 RepID=A0AAV2Z9L9_9STRA|nr:TPA: hypothetical protein N0F65_004231 [Lagenidium giganteum]
MELAVHTAPHVPREVLLFSLQLYIQHIVPTGELVPLVAGDCEVIVGFQLLHFEIVVFDTVQQGKSCLFEADPEWLDSLLKEPASLAILLMRRSRDDGSVAKLAAFAAVGMQLEPSRNGPLHGVNRYRVAEWAIETGVWSMRDHSDCVVANATGTFTLACLGKALAPHLVDAVGMRVRPLPGTERPLSPSADTSSEPTGTNTANTKDTSTTHDVTSTPIPAPMTPPITSIPRQDAAVQCETDSEDFSQRVRRGRILRIDGGKPRNSMGASGSPRRPRQLETCEKSHFLTSNKPPPLFFHNPGKAKKSHHEW